MKPTVAIVKCDNYGQQNVERAVAEALRLMGGLEQFVKPGQKVLIKPNALLSSAPELAATTHPSVISAVVREVIKAGGVALVGDSPGNAYARVSETMEKTGIKKATEEAGGRLVYFQQEGVVGKGKIHIAKIALESDVIINLPKLKTHNLTAYTGAIKNMFGVVPGFNKTHYHRTYPHPTDFAAAIVDVYEAVKPALNIMDAVIGMEGPGPSAGQPRKLGLIIAATDGVAMDAVGSFLIGHQPEQIDTTVAAFHRGLGEMRLEKIEVLGARLEEVRQPQWKHALGINAIIRRWTPKFMYPVMKKVLDQLQVWPVIDQAKCTQCLVCYSNCPTKTIKTHPLSPSLIKRGGKEGGELMVMIDLKNCISCFCCHEMCEFRAIELRRSWLARLLRLG